jgi:hypothetical protein
MKNLGLPNNNLRYYTPPSGPNDPRVMAVVRELERLHPGETLRPLTDDWVDSDSIDVRDEFVAAHADKITLSNRGASREKRIAFSFRTYGDTYGRSATPYAEAAFELPETIRYLAIAETSVLELGQALNAHWGAYTPEEAAYALLGQIVFAHARKPRPVPLGLPPLKEMRALRGPDVPMALGWINFWSPATCALLGFPDATRDARWLRGAKQGKSGAWVVRLTDDMLDPGRNPEHVKALHDAYARFPEVGGRVEPR